MKHRLDLSIEQRFSHFWNVYNSGKWEPDTRDLVRETLEPGDLFLDIGAWIGPVTLWALGCGAEVIAIEPDPVALKEWDRAMPDGAEMWRGALALYDGTITISTRNAFGDSMTQTGGEGLEVPCWTIQTILQGRVPKMAVMDIEGYELTLLPELGPFFASLGTTLQVALHTALPDRKWFAGYRDVRIPKTPRRGGDTGRSLAMVARP